jgi:hypothetical protein
LERNEAIIGWMQAVLQVWGLNGPLGSTAIPRESQRRVFPITDVILFGSGADVDEYIQSKASLMEPLLEFALLQGRARKP